MANEEHLAILKQGVKFWNDWREANPVAMPDLKNAYLVGVTLSGANLFGAGLMNAKLYGANLTDANLSYANLIGTNLMSANLRHADLRRADFREANLGGADLSEADLSGANLMSINFINANLTNANLTNTNLSLAQALRTNFKDATLTGVCIWDWNINADTNLNDVICDYLYLKWDWEKEEFYERRPHTGTFAPGKFTRLFQQAFDTIDLILKEGLDSNAFWRGFETAQRLLTGQYEARLVDKDQHINQLFTLLQSSQERLGEVPKLMAEKAGDTYNIGELKTGGFAPRGIASNNTFNDFSNAQDLTQAATQIQALLAQLQQQGHSPEAAQQQVADDLAAQAKQDPTLLGKLVLWGQKLGDATVTDVVKGVVKLALRSAGVRLP